MKYLLNFLIITCLVVTGAKAQEYSEQERRKVISELDDAIEQARERIDRMQEYGKLQRAQYMEEEAVIRDAEQRLDLLRKGTYVEPSEIEEWKTKLSKLGVDPEQEGPGVQYSDKEMSPERKAAEERKRTSVERSEETLARADQLVARSTERIEKVKTKLEQQKVQGKISEQQYQEKMEKVRTAEDRIQRLKDRIEEHRMSVAEVLESEGN
ncbi:MAG: hypothetical protein ACNS60_16360 [Candidatus Cyclobacteriaceae bacterium M2_1C_046]